MQIDKKKTTFGKTKKNSKPTPPQTFEKKHFNPETTWSTLKPQLARPYNTQTKHPSLVAPHKHDIRDECNR